MLTCSPVVLLLVALVGASGGGDNDLIDALRCLMRVWIKRELVKYVDLSPQFQESVSDIFRMLTQS